MKESDKKNNEHASRRDFIKTISLGAASLSLSGINNALASGQSNASELVFPSEFGKINWKKIRKQFILSDKKIYLNTASLGPSPKVVIDTVYQTMLRVEKNAENYHNLTEETHNKLGQLLNIDPHEIAITRNATEGMNIVARNLNLQAGDEVILTTHEHVGGTIPWLALQNEIGIKIRLVDLDLTGENNFELINNQVNTNTKVICMSHVTCTTGMILPAKEIAAFCRQKEIFSCIDGAQALGMIPIDLADINPDFYVASGHKWLFGPKGTGFLYINKSTLPKCKPVFVGAYSDKLYDLNTLKFEARDSVQRVEYGTRNTAIILGLGAAIDFIAAIGINNVGERGRFLATIFRKRIEGLNNIKVLTPSKPSLSCSILSFRFIERDNKKINEEISINGLRLRSIYENDLDAIRISFAIFNTEQEVNELVGQILKIA